jgi:hypothetical protein
MCVYRHVASDCAHDGSHQRREAVVNQGKNHDGLELNSVETFRPRPTQLAVDTNRPILGATTGAEIASVITLRRHIKWDEET